jgi:hypothetical protein
MVTAKSTHMAEDIRKGHPKTLLHECRLSILSPLISTLKREPSTAIRLVDTDREFYTQM